MNSQNSVKPPKLSCPDCGGVFRTLDWWAPGMPCPNCKSTQIAPVVEVENQEAEPETKAEEGLDGEQVTSAFKKAFSREGWRKSPIIGGLGAIVILVCLVRLIAVSTGSDGMGVPKVAKPFVCDTCGYRFELDKLPHIGLVKCPSCGEEAGCQAMALKCPHCEEHVELYRYRYSSKSIKAFAREHSLAPPIPPEHLQSFSGELEVKRPDGKWLKESNPAAGAVVDVQNRRCPRCDKLLYPGARRVAEW